MKKIIILLAAIAFAYCNLMAQPQLTEFGFFDDFSTPNDYVVDSITHRGIFWSCIQNEQTLTRDYNNKQLLVHATQKKWEYHGFSVSFGINQGLQNTIDLSKNGIFSFDITNKGAEPLSIRVKCIDNQDREIDCSPGATSFEEIWKYQTQIIVLPGQTITMKPGTANGAGGGINNTCNFLGGVWGDYVGGHHIRTDCDLKHIKSIYIAVLNAEKDPNDLHAIPLINGVLAISNFKVGL